MGAGPLAVPWRAAWSLLVFWAAMDAVLLLLLDPLLLLLLERVIALGGDPFVGNTALIGFARSPPGVAALLTAATGTIFLHALALGGTGLILWHAAHRRRIGLAGVARALLAAAPALLALSALACAAALPVAAPVAAVALAARGRWLSEGDVYFYLTTRPAGFLRFVAVVGVAAAVAGGAGLWALLRLGLAVPICLLRPVGPVAALRLAARATRGRGWVLLARMLGVLAGLAALGAIVAAGLYAAARGLPALWSAGAVPPWAGPLLALAAAGAAAALGALSRAAVALVVLGDRSAAIALPPPDASVSTPAGRWRGALALAACAAVLALSVAGMVAAGDAVPPAAIAITAHRAGSTHAPENTLAALERAVAAGADVVEIDVQETADGEVVLLHDTDLRRVAGVARFVWQMRLAELRGLDVGSWFAPEFRGERVPTLREFALAARGRVRLNVELKDNGRGEDLVGRVVAVLRETGVDGQAAVSSLDMGLLRQTRALDPAIKVGLILATGIGDLRGVDVDFVALARRLATPAVLRRLTAGGREVHVWSLEDEAALTQAMLEGAGNVITGDPPLAAGVRARLAGLSEPERALLRVGYVYRRAMTLIRF